MMAFEAADPQAVRNGKIAGELYMVRNPGFHGSPPITAWPHRLVDQDDEVMAAVEHYFLCRFWVGSGKYPAWEVRVLKNLYDAGKLLGVTPRHNPGRPVTPPSDLQKKFQNEGITDGERDLAESGNSAHWIALPPKYY